MDTRIDPETGKELVRGFRTITLTYKGFASTFDMPGWYPQGSTEGIHSGEDMKVSDRELNRLKAKAAELLMPEEIRKIRKLTRLTQTQAGILMGGGPKAFQKYEKGDLLPSKAISTLLRLLWMKPDMIDELKKFPQPKKLEEVG